MDNTAEALYMAAAVLIFMAALSLTLSSFSTFRNDLEDLILAEERIDAASTTDSTGKTTYINYISAENECRTVGLETVVNSLYRVYKENYTVVMKLNAGQYGDFTNSTGKLKKYETNLLKSAEKEQVYKKPGESKTIINSGDSILIFSVANSNNQSEYIHNALHDGLYDLLKDKKFTEYTGLYYHDDVTEDASSKKPEGVSDVNKREARIITYIQQ